MNILKATLCMILPIILLSCSSNITASADEIESPFPGLPPLPSFVTDTTKKDTTIVLPLDTILEDTLLEDTVPILMPPKGPAF
jgi:hypothetical protein